MAAGLGFKDFVTGEVLTAADVDGYLMQGVWVFASAAARDAAVTSPQEGNFAYLKDTNATTYYTGSAWASVAGGKVLQVVSATSTTTTTTTSATYTDATGITATITPSAATSKILVLISVNAQIVRSASTEVSAGAKVLRDATDIWTSAAYGLINLEGASGALSLIGNQSISYLDAPSSTSALTYKLQVAENTASGSLIINNGNTPSTITVMEIGA